MLSNDLRFVTALAHIIANLNLSLWTQKERPEMSA